MSAPAAQRRLTTRATSSTGRSTDFLAGRVKESVAGFDRVAALVPDAAPQLWQRGIALYYAGRYQDCRTQFESHRTVNPDDVENAAWHFLCVAHGRIAGEGARGAAAGRARSALADARGLPDVRGDDDAGGGTGSRRPVDRRRSSLRSSMSACTTRRPANKTAGLTHLKAAASEQYTNAGGYMHRVAMLHPLLVGSKQRQERQ